MNKWAQAVSNNASFAALLGAALSALFSAGGAYTSWQSAVKVQLLSNKQQLITSLNNASSQLISDSGKFVSAVNAGKPLGAAKDEIKTFVSQQMQASELVKIPLRLKENDVRYYQDALSDFEHRTLAVKSVQDMPEWSQSFGHVLDVQRVLSMRLSQEST